MKYLAIDPGTNLLGLACFNSCATLVSTVTISTTFKDRYARTRDICSQLYFHIPKEAHEVICEEPMMQGKANTSMQRLLGSLEQMFLPTLNYIHPMTVKSQMGSGSSDKMEVALAAGEKLQTEEEKEILANAISREAFDETDAVAVGLAYFQKKKGSEKA